MNNTNIPVPPIPPHKPIDTALIKSLKAKGIELEFKDGFATHIKLALGDSSVFIIFLFNFRELTQIREEDWNRI
jgi:hypothetical protein